MNRNVAALFMQVAVSTFVVTPAAFAGDDDGGGVPPVDPGDGFEGLFPNPTVFPCDVVDQSTSPWGVTTMFNMSAASSLRVGQSFRPNANRLDWIAVVIQNTPQGGVPGAARYRIKLASGLDAATGQPTGVIDTTPPVQIPLNSQGWFRFQFSRTVALVPGQTYFMLLEYVDGYIGGPNSDTGGTGLAVGGRRNSVYSAGNASQYWDSRFGIQNLTNTRNELIFATGFRPCVSDFNCDGGVDGDDIIAFFAAWDTSDPAADTNGDSAVDGDDVIAFLTAWDRGC